MSALFADPNFVFIGRSVRGDLTKIGVDFKCKPLMEKVRSIDIGTEAANRGMTRSNPGLEAVVEAARYLLFKPPGVRLSVEQYDSQPPAEALYGSRRGTRYSFVSCYSLVLTDTSALGRRGNPWHYS